MSLNENKAQFLSDALLVKGRYIYQPVTLGYGRHIPLQGWHSALYKLFQRDLGTVDTIVPAGLISEEVSRAKKQWESCKGFGEIMSQIC